ncbi:nuclease-related domain-containing protein [Curtobacterium sp. MCPF17_003]|uniref:nuclease-related domain-containing protein n=1 Tax=Curtobacterium sp. MCPF17_003 TaxID=2175637 RepID=UPI0035C7A3FC
MPVADRRGPLGRLFGVHPIPSEHRAWYVGAVGELAVARALAKLPDGWVVLHSVPVGERGSDIDHVLLAPTGRVITVNTKHHEGATSGSRRKRSSSTGGNSRTFATLASKRNAPRGKSLPRSAPRSMFSQ